MDKNYWKEHYAGSWKKASEKEEFIRKQIKEATNLAIINYGLGAGSSDFIEGNAIDNQKKKGDADLYIKDRNYFIEVTGPNVPVFKDAPLWFRPDKIQNAYDKYIVDNKVQSAIVHLQNDKGTATQQIRVLIMDDEFFTKWKEKKYSIIKPSFNGKEETYYSIPATDNSLISFNEFIDSLIKNPG
jgi:hypothetical protein